MTPQEIESWRLLGAATVSDAMEAMGLRRTVIPGMRCTLPDHVAVGPAFTIRQLIKHGSATHDEKLARHAAIIRQQVPPGSFVAIDAGGYPDLSSWGELHSAHSLRAGFAGLVINGCVRDAAKIRRMGFPVYSLGYTPFKSQWDFETESVGQPIAIGRVQVRSGDLIVADEDGVIVVPAAHGPAVLALGLEIHARDDALYGAGAPQQQSPSP